MCVEAVKLYRKEFNAHDDENVIEWTTTARGNIENIRALVFSQWGVKNRRLNG